MIPVYPLLWQGINSPLTESITKLATLSKDVAPTKRLAILQVMQCQTPAVLCRVHRPPVTTPLPHQLLFRIKFLNQVLLCKLIDILDDSVPWDLGPKFDSSEEPRYIQRNFR